MPARRAAPLLFQTPCSISALAKNLHACKAPCICRRLQCIRSMQPTPVGFHVLMSCKEQVKVQLAGNFAGNVFPAGGEEPSRFQILLIAAMVNTDNKITLLPQHSARFLCRFKGIGDAQL